MINSPRQVDMTDLTFGDHEGRMTVAFPANQVDLKAFLDGVDVTDKVQMRLSSDGENMAVWYTHEDKSVERFTVPLPQTPVDRLYKHCKKDPCSLIDNLPFILFFGEEYKDQGRSNNEISYALYRDVTYEMNGTLGRGVRKKLPQCIKLFIKNKWPKPVEQASHVGFISNVNPW